MPPMLGQVSFFPYNFAPAGWKFCDGGLMSIAEFDALFFLMGNRFGGDGESTFALPDLRAAAPANTHYCMAIFGMFKPPAYEGFVGETFLSFDAPSAENLLECTGQPVARGKYARLDSLMGTRFGGGGANLNLPDLRSKAPDKFRYLMTMTGDLPNTPREREPFLGELFLLPYETSSEWFMLCDGKRVQIKQNPALYSLLGNHFGGDDASFCLPDLRSAAPSKFNYYICVHGVFPNRP